MAKMKVHELAKELERQSKELVAFLQDKGYEVKAAQSSVEEEAIALVRRHFGGGEASGAGGGAAEDSRVKAAEAGPKPEQTAVKETEKAGTTVKADTAVSTEDGKKAAAAGNDAKAEGGKTDGKGQPRPNGENRKPEASRGEAPKKKKIIFVSNPQHSKMQGGQGQRQSQGQGQRQAQGGGNGNGGRRNNNDRDRDRRVSGNGGRPVQVQNAPHKIIRPTQKPIPVTAEPYEVRQRQQQERRLEQRQQEKRA